MAVKFGTNGAWRDISLLEMVLHRIAWTTYPQSARLGESSMA